VVARKVEVIRNACLAAVLLFPAVAALHAIVLAVLHVDGESFQSTQIDTPSPLNQLFLKP
jgi:hypothetical protein